jgi:hypothetical protein
MPGFLLFAKAMLVSAVTAGLMLLVVGWPGRTSRSWRRSAGWILALGAGIYAGCGVLDEWPRWPALEDRDRFLVILLPLTLAVEAAAGWLPPRGAARLLRLSLAGAAAPILLYNSTYLADLSGPNSAEWSPAGAALILLVLAAVLASVWGLLAWLQSRTGDRTVASALGLVSLAAGITVMLSGYYKGGLLGLPLAGSLAGATLASRVAGLQLSAGPCLGVGMIGTFTVLLIGRFYGALPTSTALCLLLAPLLAWIAEVPGVRRLGPSARAAVRLLCVVIPLICIVTWAQIRFDQAFSTRSQPHEPLRPGR